jgi:hypothetical protein
MLSGKQPYLLEFCNFPFTDWVSSKYHECAGPDLQLWGGGARGNKNVEAPISKNKVGLYNYFLVLIFCGK